MALQLVGEAAVAAFLQSVLRNLDAILARGRTTPLIINDPNSKLKELEEKLFSFKDLLFDGETRRLFETDVDKWMDDLKNLVYDVDDILDDINCGSAVQVSVDLSHDFSSSSTIKDRLCKVLVRADRLLEKAKLEHLNLRRGIGSVSWGQSQPIRHRPETSPSIDKSEIHGREEDIKKIVDMLLEANGSTRKNYDVICVVGMGGLGKTTLAQLVFDDQEVQRHFDVKSWACISDVFDVARATKELLEFSGQADGTHVLKSLAALQKCLGERVKNKKILVVLDDVWTATEWDKMKAPLNSCANGSKILVTTRIDKVALVMSKNISPYRLGELGHEQCLAIFNDKAFGEIDVDDVNQEWKKLGQEIVSKCGGVPLAVKVIGSMLRGAEVGRWKAVLENSLWNVAYENGEIHPAMRLSYHYLPASLKRCFEYFAVFPSDYIFNQVQLVRMWVAEGLVAEVDGVVAEDIGNEYYNDLKGRSLIQENNKIHDITHHLAITVSKKFCYQANSCEPHASVRHASFVDCFDDAINYGLFDDAHSLRTLILDEDIAYKLEDKIWSCKMLRVLNLSGGGYSSDLSNVPSSIGDLKHLRYLRLPQSSIFNLPDSICMLSNLQVLDLGECPLKNLPNNLNYLSNLRCLILGSSKLSSLPDSICMLSNLQVLDLGKCRLEYLPNNVSCLSNLRCLIIHSSKLSSLPESVCSLCKLQVLNLKDCTYLRRLPKDIGNLQSLRILKLRRTSAMLPESIVNVTGLQELKVDSDMKLPRYVGRLSGLQVLRQYPVGKKMKGRGIDQLRDMNRLKGQLIIRNMENIEDEKVASMANLKSKKHIRELKFHCGYSGNYDGEMVVKIIEALQPHDALQSLFFVNYCGNRLPGWIGLHNLARLEMIGLKRVNRMVGMAFASLIELRMRDCPTLSEVLMATPKLRKLEVRKCRELQAASFVLLPSLVSDSSVDLHLIIAQLEGLKCPCHVFEHFIQLLEAANSCCTKLKELVVIAGGVGVASLPRGWPSILKSLETLEITDVARENFQLLPNGDGTADFPSSLRELKLENWYRVARLPSDLCNLTSLQSLRIDNFPGLVSFEIQELPPDLRSFSISKCAFLTKFPDGFVNLTSLNYVRVQSCHNLVIFEDEMIPPTARFWTSDWDLVVRSRSPASW